MSTKNKEGYDQLLTFEWDEERETLEIHGNDKGFENLIKVLDRLVNTHSKDHIHLMTPDWGGNELSSEKQCDQNMLINHVKIFKWD